MSCGDLTLHLADYYVTKSELQVRLRTIISHDTNWPQLANEKVKRGVRATHLQNQTHSFVPITGQIPAMPCIVSSSLDLRDLCVVLVCRARGYKSAEAHLAPMMSFLARSIPAMTLTRSTLVSCCEAEERIT